MPCFESNKTDSEKQSNYSLHASRNYFNKGSCKNKFLILRIDMALDLANMTEEFRSSNTFTMRKVSTKHCQKDDRKGASQIRKLFLQEA